MKVRATPLRTATIVICLLILCIVLIQYSQDQSVCEGGTASFVCVISFPNGETPRYPLWLDENDDPVRGTNYNINDEVNGQNITSVLTVINVRISDNGDGFYCLRINTFQSNVSFLTVLGKYLCTYTHVYRSKFTF